MKYDPVLGMNHYFSLQCAYFKVSFGGVIK